MFVKKAAAIVCAAVLGSAAYAETAVSFSNEIGSDMVKVTEDDSVFPGIYDEMSVEVSSEKLDASVTAKIDMIPNDDGKPVALSWNKEDFDWEIVFRPIDSVSIGFSADYFLAGSYLAVEDDNVSAGKIGSDGLTLAFTGVPGLTLAATAPFGFDGDNGFNWFNEDIANEDGSTDTVYFNFGAGAEYAIDELFSIGVTAHDLTNGDLRGFGVYGSFTGIDGLALYAGYGYKDADGLCDIAGDHLVNFSAGFEKDVLLLAADVVANTDGKFYTGLAAGVSVNDAVTVSLTGTYAEYEAENTECKAMHAKPGIVYTHPALGEFSLEADIAFDDGDFESVCFPVYWKYSF